MAPDTRFITRVAPAELAKKVWALVEPGKAYALYVDGGTRVELTLEIPAGRYRLEWVNTRTGEVAKRQDLDSQGKALVVESPQYTEDVAARIIARP